MKKTLSLILSLIMLLSITSGLSFNAFAESYIDEIELYHIDTPVAGESPNFMATQYDFDGQYASDLTECKINSAPYKEGIAWFDITDNSYISPSDTSYKFKCGHGYQVYVIVEIKDTQGGQVKFADDVWARVTFGNLSGGTPGQNTAVLANTKAMPGEEDYSRIVTSEFYIAPHKFADNYEVSWDVDNNCTCTGVCKTCSKIVTETVKGVRTVKTQPTCTKDGEALYTATFTQGFDTETTTEPIDALMHDFGKGAQAEYEVEWDVKNNCFCTGKCKRCGQTITEKGTVDTEVKTAPTCTKWGETLYTAHFLLGFDDETQVLEDIEPLGHTFKKGVCTVCKAKQYTLTFGKIKKIKKSAKKTVIKVTLKKNGKILKKKKVVLKIAGKKYTVKTNKKGVATFTVKKKAIKKLKAGKKAKLVATYGKYGKSVKKVKVVK